MNAMTVDRHDPEWGEHMVDCPNCGGCGAAPIGGPDSFGNVDTTDCGFCHGACQVNAAERDRYEREAAERKAGI